MGIRCDLRVVRILLECARREQFCVIEIAVIQSDPGIFNLHGWKIRNEVECGIKVVRSFVILAGMGTAKGQLTERVGDEDPVLLRGVVEVVRCLVLLRGIISALPR